MTENSGLSIFVALIFLLEVASFFVFYSMISRGVVNRKKDYERIDKEREALLQLQLAVASELRTAKNLSSETLSKLNKLSANLDSHWQESSQKVQVLFEELSTASNVRVSDDLARIQKSRLSVEKTLQQGRECHNELIQVTTDAKRLLKALDGSIPTEEILKEIQNEKYLQARGLLQDGIEASLVARKLGLSLSEVNLMSFSK